MDGFERRTRLDSAALQLLFTPSLVSGRPALEVLDEVLEYVDVVQVRPKSPSGGRSEARACFDWTRSVLERVRAQRGDAVLVLVNDRADVARALLEDGLDGLHLGQDDMPVAHARELLGPQALIGLSTHSTEQVARALDGEVDYLGFGPVFATRTKGYERGLGVEAAWIVAQACPLPVFPIGGIGLGEALELDRVGRAAVGSAILSAADPASAARELRASLVG